MLKSAIRQPIEHIRKLNFCYKAISTSVNNQFKAQNEPILDFKHDSNEAKQLKETLNSYLKQVTDVPIVIDDEEIRTDKHLFQVLPFDSKTKLAQFYHADSKLLQKAIKSNIDARKKWDSTPFDERAKIFLKAADLLATTKRFDILATTMLGQGKTVYQAEIDAACELIDFIRFNVQFGYELAKYKPLDVSTHTINSMQLRGLEGFVGAIAPFNFTAIGGNLSSAPALMGNAVLWKPSDTAVLSSYICYKIFREAGLPPGVINFTPSDGPIFGETITKSSHLAGINFTGSVPTFKWLWRNVAQNLDTYKTYPKLSGECGGKNYHLIHSSADIPSAAIATLRSAFEYSGQKCSACSRLYVSESKWPQMRDILIENIKQLKIDTPLDFKTFSSAVIDEKAFNRIRNYIEIGKKNKNLKLLVGSNVDKSLGYYIHPTVFQTSDPNDILMKEEIFGPVLTVYVYKDAKYNDVLKLIDETTPYALTGAIFAQDEKIINETIASLKNSQGNLYINDKSTGAVVNQQPFGGSRLSGTNDKPGGLYYLLKWTSPLALKQYNLPHTTYKHTSML